MLLIGPLNNEYMLNVLNEELLKLERDDIFEMLYLLSLNCFDSVFGVFFPEMPLLSTLPRGHQ